MKISINSDSNVVINSTVINDNVFDGGKVEYRVVDRDGFIDELIGWISECNTPDKELMKSDLKYLVSIYDEYIFSSMSTNEYVSKSDNAEEFEIIGKEILEAHRIIKGD